jgi:hypothetical protein
MSREALVKKWEDVKSKLNIKDIADPFMKENLAQLMENQARKDWNGRDLLLEASHGTQNLGTLAADGYTFTQAGVGSQDNDSYRFRPIAMALMRRTFPDLFANKCVGVQAMSTPVGLAYALRVIYSDGGVNEAAWDVPDYYGGFGGSTRGTSAGLDVSSDGIADTSATGAAASAAEAWIMNSSYPELKLKLDKVTIEAESRKMGASFSLESAQDIKAMHDIDIEREMLNILQYETLAELDRQLVYRMKKASINTSNGGASISQINCSGTTALDGRWSQERFANIVASIIHQSNIIAVKTRRGPGNFAVVSPGISTVLQASGHYFNKLHTAVNPGTTFADIGVLNDTITCYRDVYARVDYALVGFKGPQISDAGVIFSPYIMGLTSKAVDPGDFSPRIGVLSRYAITDSLLGSGRYYRLLSFSNLSSILIGA